MASSSLNVTFKDKFKNYLLWQGMAMGFFVLVYGSCNHYASLQSNLYKFYFDWELNIPHWPLMMIFYRSLDILLTIVLFALSIDSMKDYAKTMMISIVLAAPIFLIFPTELGFPRPEVHEHFQLLYDILYSIDKPHNLLPSMHVTYASLGIWFIYKDHRKYLLPLLVWLSLICASVVLVHQHHVLDIPAGLILALLTYKIYFKWIKKEKTSENQDF